MLDGEITLLRKRGKEGRQLFIGHHLTGMQQKGVQTFICTDISKDGAMQGTNRELYRQLKERFDVDIIASGGVSSLEDIKALRQYDLHGAIVGKAYYTGAIKLSEAVEVAK